MRLQNVRERLRTEEINKIMNDANLMELRERKKEIVERVRHKNSIGGI